MVGLTIEYLSVYYSYSIFLRSRIIVPTACLTYPTSFEKYDSAEIVVMTEQIPILASQIAKASEKHKELAAVMIAIQHGCWPCI